VPVSSNPFFLIISSCRKSFDALGNQKKTSDEITYQ